MNLRPLNWSFLVDAGGKARLGNCAFQICLVNRFGPADASKWPRPQRTPIKSRQVGTRQTHSPQAEPPPTPISSEKTKKLCLT